MLCHFMPVMQHFTKISADTFPAILGDKLLFEHDPVLYDHLLVGNSAIVDVFPQADQPPVQWLTRQLQLRKTDPKQFWQRVTISLIGSALVGLSLFMNITQPMAELPAAVVAETEALFSVRN